MMVFPAAAEADTLQRSMETEKNNPMHNFSLPVWRWGGQRLLRCMKQNPGGNNISSSGARKSPPFDAGSDGGGRKPSTASPPEKLNLLPPLKPPAETSDARIDEIRAKLVDHLHMAADQMQYKVPDEKEGESSRPWNLRTRRALPTAPALETCNDGGGSTLPPPAAGAAECWTRSRLRGSAPAAASDSHIGVKNEKMKFSIALSREEIEEDYYGMTGSKPPRRPKKRARNIQRQLDYVFPGLWLSEISADSYKVDEEPESGKMKR